LLRGLWVTVRSPSGSGRNPAAKRFVVLLELKTALLGHNSYWIIHPQQNVHLYFFTGRKLHPSSEAPRGTCPLIHPHWNYYC